MEDDKLPFTDHLEELRARLIKCAIALGAGFAASYMFSERLFIVLSAPAKRYLKAGDSFIFTGLTEPFFTYLKLAFFAGIVLSSPVILYQLWRFVAPGLYKHERRYAFPFVLLSTVFFVGGVAFCYFAVLPLACKFFSTFASDYIRMNLRLSEYLSFSCKFLLAFGVVFELPIFVLFLSKIGVVTDKQLRSNRKYVIVIVFIVAALLTPPDVVSQVLMAVPLLVLYEISILIARLFGRKKEAVQEKPDEEEVS